MRCPLCTNANLEHIELKHALFRHLDFTTVKPSGALLRCPDCRLLLNNLDDNDIGRIENMFDSQEYAACRTMSHTLFVKDYNRPVTRTFLQAELFTRLLKTSNPAILDIGCFDGELLVELDRRLPNAELHGFDVNSHLQTVFPQKNNFRFWSGSLEQVDGFFDLISLSGCIVYINDINGLMENIQRLLKPNGLIFLQSVDISKSPYAILLGDQRTHYSHHTLGNLFSHFGFEFSPLDNSWAPREVVGLARPVTGGSKAKFTEDLHVYNCVKYLDQMADKLRALPITAPSQTGLLGTSAAAAFADSVLESQITFFVDENRNRVGGRFRDKPVLHPQSLHGTHTLIIPYGPTGHGIKSRFEKQYKGHFICL